MSTRVRITGSGNDPTEGITNDSSKEARSSAVSRFLQRVLALRVPAENDRRPAAPGDKLKALNLDLLAPPKPFGTYAEAVQTGKLLFLSGMLSPRVAQRNLLARWE